MKSPLRIRSVLLLEILCLVLSVVPASAGTLYRTNLTGLAQFYFSPGIFGQAMTTPMDVDYQDPALDGVIPNPDNIAQLAQEFGLTPESAPEPGSLLLLGSGVLGIGGLLRRRSAERSARASAN